MKKFIMLLLLGVLIVSPFSVKALAFDEDASTSSCEEKECEDNKCVKVCKIILTNSERDEVKTIHAGFSVGDGVTIKNVVASDAWTQTGEDMSNLTFTAVDDIKGVSDAVFTLATITIEHAPGVNCTVTFSLEGASKIITIPDDPTPKPVPTGVSLPVAILIGGAAIAIVTYKITNKNKKMYNI